MFGIVIASHGTLSEGLKDAANVIVGMTDSIETVVLETGADVESFGSSLKSAIEKADTGGGAIVLVDLLSASPYNQAVLAINGLSDSQKENIYVVGGANLPLLLEAINQQILQTPVHEAIESIMDAPEQNISVWNISQLQSNSSDDGFDDGF